MSATLTTADESPVPAGPIEAEEWYYSRQGVRNGPIPLEEFRRMIEKGELVPEDRVYAEGLGQWAFVHEVKDRLPPKKAASAPAAKAGPVATAERAAAAKKGATKAGPPKAAAAAAAKKPAPRRSAEESDEGFGSPARGGGGIDPENPVGQIGGRAAEILKGFPTPMGDTETSPLDFEQLDELRVAAGHRKALLRFKMMCMVLTLGTFCLVFVPLLLMVVGLAKLLPAMPAVTGAKTPLYTGLGVSAALIVVYQATGAAGYKARSWGPLALLALLVLGTGVGVWRAMANSQVVFGGLPQKILFGVGCLICLLFIGICVRAIAGAAGFVTSPAWCQEALVYSKL